MMRTLSDANTVSDTNTVKIDQGAGGCQDQQNDAKYFNQDCIHIPLFVLGVFGNQVEPVQIALT
jgi:hypothetical protein